MDGMGEADIHGIDEADMDGIGEEDIDGMALSTMAIDVGVISIIIGYGVISIIGDGVIIIMSLSQVIIP